MLKKDIKIFFIVIICACACNADTKLKDNTDDFIKNSFNKYSDVYKIINDSVQLFVDSALKEMLFIYGRSWEIDSLVCINSNNNLLVTTINKSNGSNNNAVSDVVSKLLGKKINNQWYFFPGGGTLIVPRDMYGKDAMHPLSFHELSQIARENCLASALIKDKTGNYIVNDDWVEKHFYNVGYGKYNSKAKYDSVHWHIILNKWKRKIDTNQYKPLRKNKNSEVIL